MGFGIRIMPGVRVSASGRGIRTGIGPRPARMHVGSGGLGLSTGAGPLTYYTGTGRRSGGTRPSLTAYEREARRLEKEQQFEQALDYERSLMSVHIEPFQPAAPPPAASGSGIDERRLHAEHRNEALKGIPVWRRAERKAGKEASRRAAEHQIAVEVEKAAAARDEEQAGLDEAWRRLCANDPETIIATLEEAFADNEAPAAAIDCQGDRVTVAMTFGLPEQIPDRKPDVTPTGKPTLKKRTKTDRNSLYRVNMASNIFATVRETFAVCPGIDEVELLVVRREPIKDSQEEQLAAIYYGALRREDDLVGAGLVGHDQLADRLARVIWDVGPPPGLDRPRRQDSSVTDFDRDRRSRP